MALKQARAQQPIIPPVKEKKKPKHTKSKKEAEKEFTPAEEDSMDKAAMELAKKMAALRVDLQV